MADAFVGVDEPASIDKRLDTESLTVSATTVMRQRIQIAGTTDTGIAGVDATNGLDVDVTRVIPGTGATALGKAIDTAAGATDTGVGMLAIRTDTPATVTPADGDWNGLRTDSLGRLWTAAVIQAGSAAIGTLAANSGVDIGDVDVTSVVPGTTATALGKAEDNPHASGDTGVMALAVRTASPADKSGADGDYEPLQVDDGLLWVRPRGLQTPNGDSAMDDTANAVKVVLVDATSGSAITAGSEYTEGDQDTTISGAAMMFEANTTTSQVEVVSTTNPLPVAPQGTGASQHGKAEDAAHSSGDAGVFVLGRRIDAPANSAGTSGDYCSIDVGADGGVWTSQAAAAAGGCDAFLSDDIDETEEDVKTSAGTVYGAMVTNTAASLRYVCFYNATAANTVVGTTTPRMRIGIPASASANLSWHGVKFDTAICVAATTNLTNGAPGAGEVQITVLYK